MSCPALRFKTHRSGAGRLLHAEAGAAEGGSPWLSFTGWGRRRLAAYVLRKQIVADGPIGSLGFQRLKELIPSSSELGAPFLFVSCMSQEKHCVKNPAIVVLVSTGHFICDDPLDLWIKVTACDGQLLESG